MVILWYFIELAATAFENYVMLSSLDHCFGQKKAGRRLPLLGTLVLMTTYVTFINYFHVFEGFLSVITISICVLYGLIFLQGKPLMKIILVLVTFSMLLAINMLIGYIFNLITPVGSAIFSESSGARLVALFLTKFLFFIVMRLIVKLFRKEQLQMKASELLVTLALFVLTHIIAISLIMMQFDNTRSDELTYLCILSILLTDILIFYIMRKISRDNQKNLRISLLELQLSEQKQNAEDAGHISREIKKAEHDLKHHFVSLLGLIEDGTRAEASAYIRQLLKDYETSIFKYVSIDNSAINSVLNFKIGRCRSLGIDFKIQIETDFDGFEETDLCVLLSNLLDNAIEASQRMPEGSLISLRIRSKRNYLCIEVRNRIRSSVLKGNASLRTTKRDRASHGFGLYSVSQIVEKYEGMHHYDEEDSFFVADIWLKQRIVSMAERIREIADDQTRHNADQTRQKL